MTTDRARRMAEGKVERAKSRARIEAAQAAEDDAAGWDGGTL